MIQSFTPECLNILNLNYENINSNSNIFNFIKNFRNDYIDVINNTLLNKYSYVRNSGLVSSKENLKLQSKKHNKNEIPKCQRQKIINDIFNQKYNKKCRIKWKIPENDILATKIGQNLFENSSIIKDNNNSTYFNNEKELNMEVNKIILNNELIGYSFKFSRIFNYENKSHLICKVLEIESSNKDIKFSKVKKYECIIKPVINESNFSKIISNLRKRQKRKSLELMVTKGRGIYNEEDNDNNNSIPENSPKKTSKYCSTQEISEINDEKEVIITENFIPTISNCFRFNINNLTYEFSTDIDEPNSLDDNLRKVASEKINIFNKLKKKFQKKKKSFESFISSNNSESESEANISSSGSSFISNTNSNSGSNSASPKNKESKINEETTKKAEDEIIKEKNNLNVDNKSKYDNDLLNTCYKVDLDSIYFMKYDFYKDAIVEEKSKITKIDEIKNCIKKNIPICVGKDEKYPFVSIKINKKLRVSQNFEEKNEQLFSSNNLQNMENKNNNQDIMENKINDAITNYKDEHFIKRLKRLSFLSYLLLIICAAFNVRYIIQLYKSINEAFKLTQFSSDIQSYQTTSIYYVRELTLLNFNVSGIKGGEYIKFPGKNKQNYTNFIKRKLKELFLENQSLIKRIFSSDINLSDNSEKQASQIMLDIQITKDNNNIINSDIFSSLLQYNNAFYSLALSSIPVEQNHADLFNYIYNNFNNYKKGITMLIGIYGSDYDYKKKSAKIIIIILLVVMFIIFITIYNIGVKFFISANKKRINYINIFYNISSEALKNVISESLNLIKKIKESQDKNLIEEKDFEDSLENSNSLSINKKNNKKGFVKKKTIFLNDEERNHRSVSNINIAFIIIYGILIIIYYYYFYHNYSHLIYIIKIINKNIEFAVAFQKYQIQIIDMFNVYREYLFDNETMISNLTQLQYMRKIEDEIYDTITESNIKADTYIGNIIMNHKDVLPKLVKHFCSYFETDYFDTIKECSKEFGIFIDLNFDLFSNYFLEEIKIQKNHAKYKFEHENIKGNLADYNTSNMIKEFDGSEENAIFRLDLFNDEQLHSKLNLLFINSVLPHFKQNKELIFQYIYVDGEESFFNNLFIIFFILMTIVYLGLFSLIIKILNSQIYKAKIVLSIIPINFIASQSKIKLLLNIT